MFLVSLIQELLQWLHSDIDSSHTVAHESKSASKSLLPGESNTKKIPDYNDRSSSSGFRSPVLMPLPNLYTNSGFNDEDVNGHLPCESSCHSVLEFDMSIMECGENRETPFTRSMTTAEVYKPLQKHDGKDIEEPFIEKGVEEFLEDVIIGRTDHHRKFLKHQTLKTVTAETNRSQNNYPDGVASNHSEPLSGDTTAVGSTANKTLARDCPISSAARSLQAYELVAYIGSGTFSEVTLARHKVSNELYAIKKISKEKVYKAGLVKHTFMERKMLVTLHHPFLVRLYQAFQTRTHLYLVLDFAQGGDLFYFNIKKRWVKEMKYELRRLRYPCVASNIIDHPGQTLKTKKCSAPRSFDYHGNFCASDESVNAFSFASADDKIGHIPPQAAENQEEDAISSTKVHNEYQKKEGAHTRKPLLKKEESPLSPSISDNRLHYKACNMACECINANASTPLLYQQAGLDEPEKRICDKQIHEILLRRNAPISNITECTQETQQTRKHQHHHHDTLKAQTQRFLLLPSQQEEYYYHTLSQSCAPQRPHSKDFRGALDSNMTTEDPDASSNGYALQASGTRKPASRAAHSHSKNNADASSVFFSSSAFSGLTPGKQVDSSHHCVREDAEESSLPMPPFAGDASRFPIRYIAFYAIEVALVLQYLHSEGFIYRDLKPENILLRQSGHILLTDFGVAKLRKNAMDDLGITKRLSQAIEEEESGIRDILNPTDQTGRPWNSEYPATSCADVEERTTSFTGTVEYMSPEMLQGIPHDTRTDWWSYGCLLFEWANGRKPFDGDSQIALFKSIIEENVRVIEGKDFQITALELHSYAAKLCLQYQELVCERRLSAFPCAQQDQKSSLYGGSAEHSSTPEGVAKEGSATQNGQRQNLQSSPSHTFHAASSFADKDLQVALWAKTHPEARTWYYCSSDTRNRSVPSSRMLLGAHLNQLKTRPQVYRTFIRYALADLLEANLLLRDLILDLLNRDMGKRLCGPMVLEHPFFSCRYVTSNLYDSVQPTHSMLRKATNHGISTSGKTYKILQEEQTVFSSSSAGPSARSADEFLEHMPVIQRPENWAELFSTMKIKALYVPKLRSRDDLRYFPSAVTATGLRASVEQHKPIKETRNVMRKHMRQTMRHPVEHSQSGNTRTCVQPKKQGRANLSAQSTSDEFPIFDTTQPPTNVKSSVETRLCDNIKYKDINTDEGGDQNSTAAFREGDKNIPSACSLPALPTEHQPSTQRQLLLDDATQLMECSGDFCSIAKPGTATLENATVATPSISHNTEPVLQSSRIQSKITHPNSDTKKDLFRATITRTAAALEDDQNNVGERDQCGTVFVTPTMKGTQRGDDNDNSRSFSLGTVDANRIDTTSSFASVKSLDGTRDVDQKTRKGIIIGCPSKTLLKDSDIGKRGIQLLISEDILPDAAALQNRSVAAAIIAEHRQGEIKNVKVHPLEGTALLQNHVFKAVDGSTVLLAKEEEKYNNAGIDDDSGVDYYDRSATGKTESVMSAMLLQEGSTETGVSKGFRSTLNSPVWNGEEKGAGLHDQNIEPKDANVVSTEMASLECISDEVSGLSTGHLLENENTHDMKRVHSAEGMDFLGNGEYSSGSCDQYKSKVDKSPLLSATKPALGGVEHEQTQGSIVSCSGSSSSTSSESLLTSVSMDERDSYFSHGICNQGVHRTSSEMHSSPSTTDEHMLSDNKSLKDFEINRDHFCNFVNRCVSIHASSSSQVTKHGSLHQSNSDVDAEELTPHTVELRFNESFFRSPSFEGNPLYTQSEKYVVDGLAHPTCRVIMSRTYADLYRNSISTLHGIAYDLDDESAESMTICSRTGASPSSPKQISTLPPVLEGSGSNRYIQTLESFQTDSVSQSDDNTPFPFSGSPRPSKIDFSLANRHAKVTKTHNLSAPPRKLWQRRMRQKTTTPSSPAIEGKFPRRRQSVEFLGFTYDGNALDGGFLGSANTTLATNFFDDNDESDNLSAERSTNAS